MRLTVGVDVIEIDRVAQALERWGRRFLDRIYTPGEQAYCHGRPESLAALFAGKESVMKALGTGTRGVGWREIEVVHLRSGKPTIVLHGGASRRAASMGIESLAVSLSHSRAYAVASVVGSQT